MKKPTTKQKPAAKAKAARVPSVVVKSYPHVAHVHVDGEEQPHLRKVLGDVTALASFAAQIASLYAVTRDAVKVEHRDSQDKLVSQ
jgi:hypothetical protein